MGCIIHPEREAARRCDRCGQLMCYECLVDFDGRSVCKPCVARALNAAPGYYESARPRARNCNLLLVFILSVLPGMAHMYMGLMKRGLLVMSSFFISIWLVAEMNIMIFAFLIAMICVAAFFDAMNIRKRIVAGEYAEDAVSDITGFLSRFKTPLLIVAAYLCVTSFFGYGRFYLPYYGGMNNGLLLGVIIAVTITALKKSKKRTMRDETIDARDEQERPY